MRLLRLVACLVVLLAAITGTLTASGVVPRALAASGGPIRYSYDPDGRLTGVSDPVNGAAGYAYDTVNDITSISRATAATVTVLGVSPLVGPAGTQVTITGAGFSPTASSDTVKFNGTTATVASATV